MGLGLLNYLLPPPLTSSLPARQGTHTGLKGQSPSNTGRPRTLAVTDSCPEGVAAPAPYCSANLCCLLGIRQVGLLLASSLLPCIQALIGLLHDAETGKVLPVVEQCVPRNAGGRHVGSCQLVRGVCLQGRQRSKAHPACPQAPGSSALASKAHAAPAP